MKYIVCVAPYSLRALRELATPLVAVDECAVCKTIPAYCSRFEKGGELLSDNIPEAVARLEGFIPALHGWRGSIDRCAVCHRLYEYDVEYEFLIGGSEDTISYKRIEAEEMFRSVWYTRVRVADQAFVGDVIDAAYPALRGERQYLGATDNRFFRKHCLARLDVAKRKLWVALPDDGSPITILTGHIDALSRIATCDPPPDLERAERALEYAAFADAVTSEQPPLQVGSFDAIPWRSALGPSDRMYIEDLRSASRVEPPLVEPRDDRFDVRSWVVDGQRLICRVMTVLRTGEVHRADAVIGENIPIP